MHPVGAWVAGASSPPGAGVMAPVPLEVFHGPLFPFAVILDQDEMLLAWCVAKLPHPGGAAW